MHRTKLPSQIKRGWFTVCALLMLGLLYSISSAFAQAADAVCAEVKIVIEQKLSLERQAFDAKMVITKVLSQQAMLVGCEHEIISSSHHLQRERSTAGCDQASAFPY